MSEPVASLADLRRKKMRKPSAPAPTLFDLVPPPKLPSSLLSAPASAASFPLVEPADAPKVWTVAELMGRLRGLVERSYTSVTVEGEISNWRPAASGHCYFTLKDGNAQLAIVMFRAEAQRLGFHPQDGAAVRVSGALTIYESRGQMQLVAERMEQVGLGALLAATRALKERLRAEGIFDRKRALPDFPRCIGVITSLQGAALRDIVKVCRRRHAGVSLLVYPVAVQGPNCAAEVAAALAWFSQHPHRADVVLVARGGGSWEDLHGFDDETVVRAIATCSLPVITGIGHATDSTLADAAADVCAPTPSSAAELVTASHHRLSERVDALRQRSLRAIRFHLLQARQRFMELRAEASLHRAGDRFRIGSQRLDDLDGKMQDALAASVGQQHRAIDRLEDRLARRSPAGAVVAGRLRSAALDERLRRAGNRLTSARRTDCRTLEAQLAALSPLAILERGYALIQDSEGNVVRDAGKVYSGQGVVARLARGRFRARVEYSE
jgi:exodeoxyribonuclease VII large subunit